MESMTLILLFGGLIAVLWLIPKLTDAGFSALNRSVIQPKTHAKGTALVEHELHFSSSAEASDLLRQVAEELGLPQGAPSGLATKLYMVEVDDEGIDFLYGNSWNSSFTASLSVEPNRNGCEGVFAALTWTIVGGIIDGIDKLSFLRETIESSVTSADPHARIRHVPA